jgi:acyl carrier protein
MSVEDIIKQVNLIFITVLDNPDITINRETTSSDIEEWDSLNHIQLVVAIEKHFKVRFTASEIVGFKNVEEMCLAIQEKLGK